MIKVTFWKGKAKTEISVTGKKFVVTPENLKTWDRLEVSEEDVSHV